MPTLFMPGAPDSDDPDGYVILHTPPGETNPAYAIGPFPPMEGLIAKIVEAGSCDCYRVALPVAFPKGVAMAIDITELLPPSILDSLREKAEAAGNEAILSVLGPKDKPELVN